MTEPTSAVLFRIPFTSLLPVTLISCLAAATLSAEATVDFGKDVWPILRRNCLDCHGAVEAESEFRVDLVEKLIGGGGSGIATVVPHDVAESYLVEVLREPDEEYRMPHEADPLPETQIATIEKWIEQGAPLPENFAEVTASSGSDFWSLRPVERPTTPVVAGARTPVDAFLLQALHKRDLDYNPPADARALIRRTAVILTGLPPTPEHIAAFQQAHAEDPRRAFENLVDDYLASPHFGERWAQHWLDVIRWAETNGSEANLYRKNAWMYRDYVVNAFNADLPYDQFIREQIAGDQLGVGVATGFLVAGPHVPAATVGREESAIRQARADRLDEIAQTVGASMIGLTVSCARCHNHKFDPISIGDYYSLTGVFQGVEFGGRYPETDPRDVRQREAKKLLALIEEERSTLAREGGVWQEYWQGWGELHFAPVMTKAVRVSFDQKSVNLDELELFGPDQPEKNLALSSGGTLVFSPEEHTQLGGEADYLTDGDYSTMVWKGRTNEDDGSRPWVQFEFPEPNRVDRLTLSNNREYFFETDYLSSYNPFKPVDFKVEVRDEAGNWVEIAATQTAASQVRADPEKTAASARLQETIDLLLAEGPQPSFVGQFVQPAVAHILHRGSPESPRDEVPPAGLAVLDGDLGLDNSAPDPERRLKFADWMADPGNPLTSRVMVNRIWHHVFGAGIVTTPADFGVAGAPPSHPELLDYLAAEFVHPQDAPGAAWSVKSMIRRLLLTDAYVQSSAPRSDGLTKDAGAMYLWRFPPRRVEAEVIRDGILQAAGKLDPTLGGPSYRIHNVKKTYAQWEVVDNHSPETWRRLIYQERMRRVDDRNFTAFDFPDCGQVQAKRPISTTPLQALNLMNSAFAVEQADFIAARAVAESTGEPRAATIRLFELVLGRDPDAEELAACLAVVDQAGLRVVSRTLLNANEFAFLP